MNEQVVDGNGNRRLENFAAELASAAYGIALQSGAQRNWLDLELDLWKAVTDRINAQGSELVRC